MAGWFGLSEHGESFDVNSVWGIRRLGNVGNVGDIWRRALRSDWYGGYLLSLGDAVPTQPHIGFDLRVVRGQQAV